MAAHKLGWTRCEIWYASCSPATADSKSMYSFARTCGMLRSLNTLLSEVLEAVDTVTAAAELTGMLPS